MASKSNTPISSPTLTAASTKSVKSTDTDVPMIDSASANDMTKSINAPKDSASASKALPIASPKMTHSNVLATKTLVDMMSNQKELYNNLSLIKKSGLSSSLRTQVEPKHFNGLFVFYGAQSTGKSSVISRMLGCELLVSIATLGTRWVLYF